MKNKQYSAVCRTFYKFSPTLYQLDITNTTARQFNYFMVLDGNLLDIYVGHDVFK